MFLTELFKQSVPYEKVHEDGIAISYAFKLGGVHYEVYFERATLPAWQRKNLGADYGQQIAKDIEHEPVLYVEFSTLQGPGGKDRYALTNRGQAPTILSTVISIIDEVLKAHPVRYIKFDAKETNRQSLYKRIAKRFGKEVYEVSRPVARGLDKASPLGDRLFLVKLR